MNELGWQETALPVFVRAAMRQGKRSHRAGDRDGEETALFIEGAFGFGSVVRQDACGAQMARARWRTKPPNDQRSFL